MQVDKRYRIEAEAAGTAGFAYRAARSSANGHAALPEATSATGSAPSCITPSCNVDRCRASRQAAEKIAETLNAPSGLPRIKGELMAVLVETRSAANRIIGAAEQIEQRAARIRAALPLQEDANALARHVGTIYEASYFQDLTSQRVAQIMATLDRLNTLLEREDAVAEEAAVEAATGRAAVLDGPLLPGAAGHITQAEIDLMFD